MDKPEGERGTPKKKKKRKDLTNLMIKVPDRRGTLFEIQPNKTLDRFGTYGSTAVTERLI